MRLISGNSNGHNILYNAKQSKVGRFVTEGKFFLLFSDSTVLVINPRTYMQIHTPTVDRGTRGWGGWTPLEFLIRCSISKRFYLQWKAFDILHKMRYILSVMALLGGLWRHQKWSPSWIYQELEIKLKPWEMVTFLCLRRKITQNKQFAWFYISHKVYFYCWKKVEKTCTFTQKWFDHLLLMTLYLVTIVKLIANRWAWELVP